MKNLLKITALLCLISSNGFAASWGDIASGCMMGMGGSLAGTSYIQATSLEEKDQLGTEGILIGAGLGCLGGMAYVSITSSSAKEIIEASLKSENGDLLAERNRLAKQKCLITGACTAGSKAILIETVGTVRTKQGDRIHESSSTTIEVNE